MFTYPYYNDVHNKRLMGEERLRFFDEELPEVLRE